MSSDLSYSSIFRKLYYFPTHCKKRLWAASAHPAHVQVFEKLLRTIRPPSTGKHRTFTRSWQTPSLTVLALRCCSDNLIQNLQKRAPDKETPNWTPNATFEAGDCEKLQGSPSKAQLCTGCLAEERGPLTAHWPFPKLRKIPPLVGIFHPHSRLLGPAKNSIIKFISCVQINLILHKNV